MTQQNPTRHEATFYFSARRLAAIFGRGDALHAALEQVFQIKAERGAVLGWVQRDQIPGPVIAQMMMSAPAFPVRNLIARRGEAAPPAGPGSRRGRSAPPAAADEVAALMDLLS